MLLRNSRPPKYFSCRFCRAAPTPSKYNWTTDNRSFNITLLQYQRIVRVPGRDIEWELRVPPFCLGRASEPIRQINERWTYVGARPLSVPLCHLSVPWIPAQSDSDQPFTVATVSLNLLTHTSTLGWSALAMLKQLFPFHFESAFVQCIAEFVPHRHD